MSLWSTRGRLSLFLLVLTGAALVQSIRAPAKPPAKPAPATTQPAPQVAAPIEIVTDPAKLPAPVRDMRDAILAAARSGDLSELILPIQWNELPPDFGPGVPGRDPREAFKKASVDGNGREILGALVNILTMPCAVVREGRDIENNKVYIWPYLARLPLDKLTPPQDVDLLRLLPRELYAAARKRGEYLHWFVTIGADGTWHSFRKGKN